MKCSVTFQVGRQCASHGCPQEQLACPGPTGLRGRDADPVRRLAAGWGVVMRRLTPSLLSSS